MTWRIVGIDFSHEHMNSLLEHARDHPDAEVVGLCDDDRERSMADVDATAAACDLPSERVYSDPATCLRETDPDVAMLCPTTGDHADRVEEVAEHDVHVVLEKPFAASLADADRILDAMRTSGELAINWPLAWYPPHRTTKRLIDEGTIGEVVEVHYYDGNSGSPCPGSHPWAANESEATGDDFEDEPGWWFYRSDQGGGSLLDYLGYGTTLATWFRDGEVPSEVSATTYTPAGLEVDEGSVTVARYDHGLSTFRTRWGTFSDPWTAQPRPKCGFEVLGTNGTIGSYDYEGTIQVQTPTHPDGRDVPVDELAHPHRNPIEYVLDCLDDGRTIGGPLSPAINRKGQRIIETAIRSAREKRTLPLVE